MSHKTAFPKKTADKMFDWQAAKTVLIVILKILNMLYHMMIDHKFELLNSKIFFIQWKYKSKLYLFSYYPNP